MPYSTLLSTWRTSLATLAAGLALFSANPAHAQPGCNRGPVTWGCFGVFEVHAMTPKGEGLVRLTHFSNGEMLAETTAPGGAPKRLLTVPPGGLSLASGPAADESLQPGARNPFMFLDMAFAYPGMALQAAYPGGAMAVPVDGVDVPVTVDGKTPVVVRATRRADGVVVFHLTLTHQGATQQMDGLWVQRLAEPWPDDFAVTAWRQIGDAGWRTLGEVRAASRAQGTR